MINNEDMFRHPGLLEKVFVIIAMLYYSGAFIALYREETGFQVIRGQQDALAALISYPLYIITFFLTTKYASEFFTLVKKEKFLACLMGLALLSSLWSDFPWITLKRSAALIGTSLLGVYLAVRYTLKEQLQLLTSIFGIIAIFSLLFAVLLPSFGLMSGAEYAGSWRGIFVHKNTLGRIMALSLVVLVLVSASERKYLIVKWGLVVLSFGLLILSRSMTSLIMCMIMFALLPFYKALRSHIYLRVFLFSFLVVAVVVTGVLLFDNLKLIMQMMNRDLTLTGRADLWENVLYMIRKRPFLGYGFNAFWLGPESGSEAIRKLVGWKVSHSHNGLLDLCLDLGSLGVLVFLLSSFQAVRNAVSTICSSNNMESLWPLAYMTFIVMSNMTEGSLLTSNNIFWVLFVSVTTSLYSTNTKKITLNNYKEALEYPTLGTICDNRKNQCSYSNAQ